MGPQFFVDGGFVCTYKGITRLLGRGSVRITPARAGKSLENGIKKYVHWDHPRTRGEKFHCTYHFITELGSPPHTRGKAREFIERYQGIGITPAHAGKSPIDIIEQAIPGDHPRTRGEKKENR